MFLIAILQVKKYVSVIKKNKQILKTIFLMCPIPLTSPSTTQSNTADNWGNIILSDQDITSFQVTSLELIIK